MTLPPEKILARIDDLITQMTRHGMAVARLEASLKAWEAATKSALIDSGMSAAQAESNVRANPEWSSRYEELEVERMKFVEAKARIDQGDRYWRTWQSEFSAEKRAVS